MTERATAYEHPEHVLPGVRSLLMLAAVYRTAEPQPAGPGEGLVARYAWSADYHDTIRRRLHALADFHRRLVPTAAVRGVVDTAPLLERQFAQLAGLGWIGKNTLLINPQLGSWLFLAALLTSEPLTYDDPAGYDRCGTCRACLNACPTGALVEPRRLDARKCISYLTIEARGTDPGRIPAVARTAGVRLRCVSGRVSLEPSCGGDQRPGLSAFAGHEPLRSSRIGGDGRGRVPRDSATQPSPGRATPACNAMRPRFSPLPLWERGGGEGAVNRRVAVAIAVLLAVKRGGGQPTTNERPSKVVDVGPIFVLVYEGDSVTSSCRKTSHDRG